MNGGDVKRETQEFPICSGMAVWGEIMYDIFETRFIHHTYSV